MANTEKHLIVDLETTFGSLTRTTEPTLTTSPYIFTSDGTGGLLLDHLYYKSITLGLVDLSGAITGVITGGSNVGGENEVFKDVSGTLLRFRTIKAGTNITITQNTDDVEIDAAIVPTFETKTTSVSAVIDSTIDQTEFIIDTVGVTATTLADGTTDGQKKIIFASSITGGGSVEVTASLSTGTKATFSSVGQCIELTWSTTVSKWIIISAGAFIS